MGIAAEPAVVAAASNGFTVAGLNDAGMLDVVGSDAAGPRLVGDLVGGAAAA